MSDLDELYFDPGTIELDGKDYSFKDLTRIERDDISGELERLPSTLLHVGQVEIGLWLKINDAQIDREVMRSRKYIELFRDKKEMGYTEETIKAKLKDDLELLAMDEQIDAMTAYKQSLGNLMNALRDKRESLRHMAARELEEFRSQELTVRQRA